MSDEEHQALRETPYAAVLRRLEELVSMVCDFQKDVAALDSVLSKFLA